MRARFRYRVTRTLFNLVNMRATVVLIASVALIVGVIAQQPQTEASAASACGDLGQPW
jgi:hypothetical protein